MLVHVLLYEAGTESEGIHSLELKGTTVILMFEDRDDADRYCGLLEAQDFPTPSVEELTRRDIEAFCIESGYEARYVEKGFIPSTDEERLLISPPLSNLEVGNWKNQDNLIEPASSTNDQLEDIKKRLENLL
ncbi:DUF3110 domain-containing protein [Prochlorococcus marinus]|uniref:DUF3110 domain-containing protein n=1 Tax=Prochlorococcus marinus TaxID=1219 RepID=UPI0022B5434B|nr:DUF3110 domain-containing protein [Prochlorococcus marinus]